MTEHDLLALPVAQLGDEPIAKTADLEDRHELGIDGGELFEEDLDILPTRTYLSAQDRVTLCIADAHGNLFGMLVNGEYNTPPAISRISACGRLHRPPQFAMIVKRSRV